MNNRLAGLPEVDDDGSVGTMDGTIDGRNGEHVLVTSLPKKGKLRHSRKSSIAPDDSDSKINMMRKGSSGMGLSLDELNPVHSDD